MAATTAASKYLLKNWNQVGASTVAPGTKKNQEWKIYYRFYDPMILDPKTGKPKEHYLEHKAGINRIGELSARRKQVRIIVAELEDLIQVQGWNPATGQIMAPAEPEQDTDYEIHPSTPFIEALLAAHKRLKVVKHTADDIKSIIRGTEEAAKQLRYTDKPISEVKKRHVRALLTRLEEIRPNWSANQFNHYRRYYGMLFKELSDCEAIEANPILEIGKRKTIKKLRAILSDEQARIINEHLHRVDYFFWRFIHIFFHSGAREIEMFRLQVKHVDLERQEVLYTVLKGARPEETKRPIKDVALPLWKELLRGAKPDDFLFGRGLEPGKKPVKSEVVTRRWQKLVKAPKKKGGLGITCDLYSLKHLNVTETMDLISSQLEQTTNAMMAQTGHKSPDMITGHYDIGAEARKNRIVRSINNAFGRKNDNVDTGNAAAG